MGKRATWRRRILAASLSALVASLYVVVVTVPANAVNCAVEEQIIVQMTPSSETGRGDAGWNYVRDRDLGTNCEGSAAFSTVNIHNSSFTRWVEIGWVEKWDCYTCSPRTKFWRVFIEGKSASGTGFGNFSKGLPISPGDVGQWDRFKLNNVSGTNLWNFWWMNDAVNGTYQEIPVGFLSYDWDAGFQGGYVFGETGRYPAAGTGTGASDYFLNLVYKDCGSTCTWRSWPGSGDPKGSDLGFDNMDGWKWSRVASDEYQVVSCTSPC